MIQPTLIDPERETMQPIPEHAETAIAVAEPPPQPSPALMEFRKGFMEMSIPRMLQALSEYGDWRKAFRNWLLSVMVEGIHYGWAVGYRPKWCDETGKDMAEDQATHSKTFSSKNNKWTITPISEFLPKRNLLLAGADLVCDLLWVRDEYEADMQTWEQLGKVPGKIVRKCKLYSKITNEFIGEGTGGRTEGEKFMALNSSIKMGDNSAKRCAVLNAYGLRDLFTQDMEEPQQTQHENPTADPAAPKTAPRGDRVPRETIVALWTRWKKCANPDSAGADDWSSFATHASNRIFDVKKPGNWTPTDVERVNSALEERAA